MIMTRHQTLFLELLRAGLWGLPADASHFQPAQTDWNAILKIAKEQTVMVIVTDGIETLPQELWPRKEAMMKLMMVRVRTEQMHQLLNSTLNQIVSALNDKDIPSVLLKGQGVAQNYRKPTSRSCGDIDLYTGLGGYEQACRIIDRLNNGQEHKEAAESDHHMHMSLNGVEIEIHRYADMMPGKRLNARLQQWTKESIDAHFGTDALNKWDNNGTIIQLATATFDAFFILHHAVRHMTTEGVGFRQICDWTMYLHKNHSQINPSLLQQKLEEFHMTAVWNEFGRIATDLLGLPAEELPLASGCHKASKTEDLLRHIFISGNFGRFDTNARDNSKTTYLKRKWRSFSYQSSRLFKLFNLFPRYISHYAWGWLCEAVGRVARGK